MYSERINGVIKYQNKCLVIPVRNKKKALTYIAKMRDRKHIVEIKEDTNKRSLNANNYAWSLIDKLAEAMRMSKEEMYLRMLKRYGKNETASIRKDASKEFKAMVKYYESRGESVLKGDTYEHIRVFKGSSEFNTKEMADLINGIVDECKEQDIETMPPHELEQLKKMWDQE